MSEYGVIGTRPPRPDGEDKVLGTARYGADVERPAGCLAGAVLRSPHGHARILGIDTAPALAIPGVRAVVTAADLPAVEAAGARLGEGPIDLQDLRSNVLAEGRALYHGHAIAAVAADDERTARDALARIVVEYEPLPAVTSARAAMAAGAPVLHPTLHERRGRGPAGGGGLARGNVASHQRYRRGDPEAALARAPFVVERTVETLTVHQGYIEPHNVTARWTESGVLEVWLSTQGAFLVQMQLAALLTLEPERVRVVPMEIGGGFGGKIQVYLEPLAALLARKSGAPVHMVMSRAEELLATGPAPGAQVSVRLGAEADGRIVAASATLAYEAGAFPGSAVREAAACVFAPYAIENVSIDAYDVVVNKPKSAPYRAPGAANAVFACEVALDELARTVGLDPIALRLRNRADEGYRRVDGPVFGRIGLREVLETARAHEHYGAPLTREPRPGARRGRGVAASFWLNGSGRSTVRARVRGDGTVRLVEGSTDIGGTRLSVAMQFAEVLGIPIEAVRAEVVDTDEIPWTDATFGSRVTFATGMAAHDAAQAVQRRVREHLAARWGVGPERIERIDGRWCVEGGGESVGFAEVARALCGGEEGGFFEESATVDPEGVGVAFAAHVVDVEVDTETGAVEVLRYTAVQDVGSAIHPSHVEGQIQGGVVQGIGWALMEGMEYGPDGRLRNQGLLDYRMPTALDVPFVEAVLVEVPNPGHPFGVRGVGEIPIVAPPASIANAIHDAIGVRLDRLPMTPRRVLEALGVIAAEDEDG